MTTPHEEQPQTEVPATPSVTTAPPRARWRFANVPSRLGRARTSTVVLAVLFVAVFVLWVYVRPPTVATPAGTTSGGTGPAAPPATSAPASPTTTQAPPTTQNTTPPARPHHGVEHHDRGVDRREHHHVRFLLHVEPVLDQRERPHGNGSRADEL